MTTQAGRPRLRRFVVGPAMASDQMEETLLPKWLALPIFASDPLSSVAYATEAALVVLVGASAGAAHLVFPISLGIALLLAIVIASYRQTVLAYETSGGAYIVAKENLGRVPSLVAAAALLTDYILTVAVSVAAGVLALTSAVSALRGHELGLSLICVVLITLANLRGVKEAGVLFALPTYAFVTAILVLIGTGVTKCATSGCPQAVVPHPIAAGTGAVTLFVVLRAFASGSTALTGVEAIANGVNAFRRPHGRNAAKTLATLGTIAIVMFVGVSWLAVHMNAIPADSGTPSVLSQLARGVFPSGSWSAFMYWAVQILTLAVLVLAANTSFQGFPRLAALLARDRFFARQFTNLGDRLVFSNGIIVLAAIASTLLIIYNASVDSLIHLYVIGVFSAFTLSQAGMVRYWLRTRDPGWRYRAALNGVGSAATGLVTLVVIWTKFTEGAWLVIVAIPLFVLAFVGINRHYRRFARRLAAGVGAIRAAGPATNHVLLWVESLDVATEGALWYSRQIADNQSIRAVLTPGRHTDSAIRPRWFDYAPSGPKLERLATDEGRTQAVLEEVWSLPRSESDFVTVVVPEQFRGRSLLRAATRTSFRLKLRLLSEPGTVIADVPVVSQRRGPEGVTPSRLAVRVLISDIHAGSLRALTYADSLGIEDTRAVSFAFDSAEADQLADRWTQTGVMMPLDLSDAPYRDVGTPLLAYIRELTADPETVVNVVMPEIVVRGWSRVLHNQRAIYVKRLLLFEPHVILSSVPYQLFR
ncbi:MAG TPA: APC family permease [Gaiellaceae bacterium]|nr:APC family permease [Gaiellaceae bacterium]